MPMPKKVPSPIKPAPSKPSSSAGTTAPTIKAKSNNVHQKPADDEEIVFQEVADVTYHRSWAFYGRAGTGKTTVLGSFPGDVLLIDIQDEGTDSVKDVKGLVVIPCRSWARLEAIYWDIVNNPAKYARFKSIGLDTVTQLQTLCIQAYMESKGNNKAVGGWGSMKQKDWGAVSSMMKEVITDWRNLPFNTIFLAQDREDKPHTDDDDDKVSDVVQIVKDDNEPAPIVLDEEDQDGIMPSIGPSLSPATAKHLCAAVHVIGYTFVKDANVKKAGSDKPVRETQYHMRIGPHPIYSTKVRKPKIIGVPKTLLDPSYEKLIAVLDGK